MVARETADGPLSLPHLENASLISLPLFWVSGFLSFLRFLIFFSFLNFRPRMERIKKKKKELIISCWFKN